MNPARRRSAIRAAGLGLAALLPLRLDDCAVRRMRGGAPGGIGGAAVPPTRISLADFGGTPGAGAAALVDAFGRAFAALGEAGGGTLVVPAGVYDFGRHDEAADIVLCRGLRDIAISAYGATFKATTTANVVPHLFYFFNFHNVTIAGASFMDAGFSPWFNWRGMYCVGIQADQPSSGFHLVDCYAQRVVGLLASNNDAAGREHMADVRVRGEVHCSYYGVSASNIRTGVSVELACHNVRRAFIAYALHDADITVTAHSTPGWPGSNGLVALASRGAGSGNVENVTVRVEVSGECIHDSYVHFYHQGRENAGHIRDVDARVDVINGRTARSLFLFDHEERGVRARTPRSWDRIALHGSISGKFKGRVVSNPSVSTAPGTVYLDQNLARLADVRRLGRAFRVRHAPHDGVQT